MMGKEREKNLAALHLQATEEEEEGGPLVGAMTSPKMEW